MPFWRKHAEPAIAKLLTPDCCLNAVRLMIDVFGSFGVPLRAMATTVMVVNPKMWQLCRLAGRWPQSDKEFKAWCDQGAYSLGVTGEMKMGAPFGWPWHLVAVDGDRLLDPSAAQFNRPDHNIALPATVAVPGLPKDWIAGGIPAVAVGDGGTAIYTAQPLVKYTDLSGFQRHGYNLAMAIEIRAAIADDVTKIASGK